MEHCRFTLPRHEQTGNLHIKPAYDSLSPSPASDAGMRLLAAPTEDVVYERDERLHVRLLLAVQTVQHHTLLGDERHDRVKLGDHELATSVGTNGREC